MKKFLPMLLAAVMLCCMMASSVFALNYALAPHGTQIMEFLPVKDWYNEAYEFVKAEFLMYPEVIKTETIPSASGAIRQTRSFLGEKEITRAEVSEIIHRYDWNDDTLGSKYKNSICTAFKDVPNGKSMTPAVQWAAECGIVNGVGGKYFAPNRTITREEFATIMYRYTEYKDIECDTTASLASFPDSGDVSAWAKDAVSWAVGEGLISGKPGGLLAPQDTITRAEVALIVYRYNNSVLAHRDNMK